MTLVAIPMVSIDPNRYSNDVEIENGKKVLYVVLKQALCGALKAGLLFWKISLTVQKNEGSRSTPMTVV